MFRALAIVTTLAFALPSALPAIADAATKRDRRRAKRLGKQASRDFRAKRYNRALMGFKRAHELVKLPALQYNIGQCHLLLKQYEEAIAAFEQFLEQAPDTPYAGDVQGLIAEARAEIEKNELPPLIPLVAPKPLPRAERTPPPIATAPPPSAITEPTTVAATTSGDDDDIVGTWWFWTLVGGAVVAGSAVAVVAAQGDTTTVLPMGDLGVIDRRL